MSNKEGISTGKGFHPFSEFSNPGDNPSGAIIRNLLWSGSEIITKAQGAQINDVYSDNFLVLEVMLGNATFRTMPIKIPPVDLTVPLTSFRIPLLDGIDLNVNLYFFDNENPSERISYLGVGLFGDKVTDGTTVTVTKIYEEL